MTPPRQLVLDLALRPALGRADFLVSRSNEQAVAAIDAWPEWSHSELLLSGPAGSGKSHLVEVWRARSGAVRVPAGELNVAAVPGLATAPAVAVEDCGPGMDEAALFHLLNEARRNELDMMLTLAAGADAWHPALPDLASRLRRMPVVRLAPPDDRLMEAVLVKLFADRQIEVEPPVVRYLAMRLERSFDALRAAVDRLDRLAIAEKRPVTRALAARILGPGEGDGD